MSKVDKIKLQILKAKIQMKPKLFIQQLQQQLDKAIREKKNELR